MLPKQTAQVEQELFLAQRRAYMQLPLAERRKRLAAQADQMAEHYEQELERTERIAWQGGTWSSPNPVIPQRLLRRLKPCDLHHGTCIEHLTIENSFLGG